MSAIALLEVTGAEDTFKQVISLSEEGRRHWEATHGEGTAGGGSAAAAAVASGGAEAAESSDAVGAAATTSAAAAASVAAQPAEAIQGESGREVAQGPEGGALAPGAEAAGSSSSEAAPAGGGDTAAVVPGPDAPGGPSLLPDSGDRANPGVYGSSPDATSSGALAGGGVSIGSSSNISQAPAAAAAAGGDSRGAGVGDMSLEQLHPERLPADDENDDYALL